MKRYNTSRILEIFSTGFLRILIRNHSLQVTFTLDKKAATSTCYVVRFPFAFAYAEDDSSQVFEFVRFQKQKHKTEAAQLAWSHGFCAWFSRERAGEKAGNFAHGLAGKKQGPHGFAQGA